MDQNKIIVFGLSNGDELTDEICTYLNCERGKINISHFADGEVICEPLETVRGRHVFLVQPTCFPVNDSIMELLIAIDACKRASANEVTCIIPYYGYARQERKSKPRQPVSARLVADLLETAGADRVVAIDLHASAIQGFFKVPNDDLSAVPLFAQYYLSKTFDNDIVVVSPDHGGVTRARNLANYFENAGVAIIDKRRVKANEAEALSVIGDVKDKTCIIVDDICDTGGSLIGACKILRSYGAKEVYFCCTHALFNGTAVQKIRDCEDLKEVVITNTIPQKEEKKDPKIKVISVAYLLAQTIQSIHDYKPVSEVAASFAKK